MFIAIYTIYLTVLFLMMATVAASMVGGVAMGSRKPFWFVVAYWLLLFYFPNASFGLEYKNIGASTNIYTRGSGLLIISGLNAILIGLLLLTAVSRYFKVLPKPRHNLGWYFWGFGALFVAGLAHGLGQGDEIRDLLGDRGTLHVINMILAFLVLVSVTPTHKDLKLFVDVFLVAAVTRALYGAVRFVFMSGDPANFYANFENINIKLTFFDVNDGFIATMAAFLVAWRLLLLAGERAPWRKLMYWGILGLEVFIVVFSFRRTGWGGFALAALLFAFVQARPLRVRLLVTYVALGVPLFIAQGVKRLNDSAFLQDVTLLERLAPDVFLTTTYGDRSPRFVELSAAWKSILESPILGLGINGQFDGRGYYELAFHRFDFGWMHSGVMHIWLKMGLIGVVLLLGIWWSFLRFVQQHHEDLTLEQRGWMFAGVAGFLFFLPTWALGTPVIEYRTMQLNALALALPYMAWAVAARSAPARAAARARSGPRGLRGDASGRGATA